LLCTGKEASASQPDFPSSGPKQAAGSSILKPQASPATAH